MKLERLGIDQWEGRNEISACRALRNGNSGVRLWMRGRGGETMFDGAGLAIGCGEWDWEEGFMRRICPA
jgi:hypothetical protein